MFVFCFVLWLFVIILFVNYVVFGVDWFGLCLVIMFVCFVVEFVGG